MKTIKYFYITICVLLFSSCTKWLDVKPTAELDQSDLFASEGGYVDALRGVYANLTKPALYGRELTWGALDVMAGIYGPSITGDYNSMLNYQYKRDNVGYSTLAANRVDAIWDGMYKQIANLNALLENIDKNPNLFTGDNYSIIKGEALGLRAVLHFELLKLYGPSYASGKASTDLAIPYIASLSTQVAPVLTVENAMQFLLNDLEEAKKLLEKDPIHLGSTPSTVLSPTPEGSYSNFGVAAYHNRRFSFNYYAVLGTMARAYLWKGDKDKALLAAKEVIDDQEARFPWVKETYLGLPSNVAKLDQDRTFATEHIFALNIRDINTYMGRFMYFEDSPQVDTYLSPYAYLSYANIFEGGTDIRRNYLATTFGSYNFCNKYYQVNGVYSFFQQRVPLMRISEMYYIAAECDNNLSAAIAYLDRVRSKRGLSSMALSTSLTRSQLDAEIVKEYRKEFIAEGQLWYYIKRKDLDLTNYSADAMYYGIYYFTNKNQYVIDRPVDEDGNR